MSIFSCCEREDETKYFHTCGCPSASFTCVSEQVTPTLCGYSEYVSPSTPPKKYRKETQTNSFGSYTLNQCCQPSFIDPYEVQPLFIDQSTSNYTSTSTYDISTCAVTSVVVLGNATRTDYQYCDGSPTGTSSRTYADSCGGYAGNVTLDPTTSTTKGEVCAKTQLFNASAEEECEGSVQVSLNGTGSTVLSSEDLDSDAVNRETPSSGTSCSSLWSTRDTGFSWTERTSSYEIECASLVVGFEYEVAPLIRRRTAVIGSEGAWEDVTVTAATFTATSNTKTLAAVALGHIQGYEYQITGVTIEKT
jgi:hypothetical protein